MDKIKFQFSPTSLEWLRVDMSAEAKLILTIAYYSGQFAKLHGKPNKISNLDWQKWLGISENSVRRHLVIAEESGFMIVEKPAGQKPIYHVFGTQEECANFDPTSTTFGTPTRTTFGTPVGGSIEVLLEKNITTPEGGSGAKAPLISRFTGKPINAPPPPSMSSLPSANRKGRETDSEGNAKKTQARASHEIPDFERAIVDWAKGHFLTFSNSAKKELNMPLRAFPDMTLNKAGIEFFNSVEMQSGLKNLVEAHGWSPKTPHVFKTSHIISRAIWAYTDYRKRIDAQPAVTAESDDLLKEIISVMNITAPSIIKVMANHCIELHKNGMRPHHVRRFIADNQIKDPYFIKNTWDKFGGAIVERETLIAQLPKPEGTPATRFRKKFLEDTGMIEDDENV